MGSSSAPDPLVGALRALTAPEFEQLAEQLPPRWRGALWSQGIDLEATGFGVIFKARWQSLARPLRAELAEALGGAAVRLAGHRVLGPRLQAVATADAARSSQRPPVAPPALAPGVIADRLVAASDAADEAVATAVAALDLGRPCAEELLLAVAEYNEAVAAATQVLADNGVDLLPDGRAELLARLHELAANADREPLRAAVAAFAETESDLPLVRNGRRRAAALLARPPADWDQEQFRLAEGLTAVMELRRLVAAEAGPTDLLAMSARADSSLPPDLHGLVVLAASGSFPAPRASQAVPATATGTVAVA